MNRRGFLTKAIAATVVAPAIVRAESLMKVSSFVWDDGGHLIPEDIARQIISRLEWMQSDLVRIYGPDIRTTTDRVGVYSQKPWIASNPS